MRALVQFQWLSGTDDFMQLLALDEDGTLWHGNVTISLDDELKTQWVRIQSPPDSWEEPRGDRFDRFERAAREGLEKDDRLQTRLDSLPGTGDEDDEEPTPTPDDPAAPSVRPGG